MLRSPAFNAAVRHMATTSLPMTAVLAQVPDCIRHDPAAFLPKPTLLPVYSHPYALPGFLERLSDGAHRVRDIAGVRGSVVIRLRRISGTKSHRTLIGAAEGKMVECSLAAFSRPPDHGVNNRKICKADSISFFGRPFRRQITEVLICRHPSSVFSKKIRSLCGPF